MTTTLLIAVAAFIGVATLVGGIATLLTDRSSIKMEDRLQMLTGISSTPNKDLLKQSSVLSQPLDNKPGFLENLVSRIGNVNRLLEQADSPLAFPQLAMVCGALAVAGMAIIIMFRLNLAIAPLTGLAAGVLPFLWLVLRRRKRLRKFGTQLPEALDMLGRSLRSGQSLSFGINMVAAEIAAPLGTEFGRLYEEQNLGVSLEDSLKSLSERVPNLDLRFFTTAVILQRQTGGDLAEILDKISHLIRERFEIWGQIQALTGEGRLSGIVLLALPILLFGVMYRMNHDYLCSLFTDPMGKKMLLGAVILQVLGALVIRKIVDIKV